MRFHCGISFRPKLSWLKWILLPLLGLLAYFGIGNFVVLAATGSLFPTSVEVCNTATGSCSTNWLERYEGTSSIRYQTISGYSAISSFNVNYDSSTFAYYCYEDTYKFHATYELDYRITYRGVDPNVNGTIAGVQVFANNSRIASRTTINSSSGIATVKFDYPGYGTNIKIKVDQSPNDVYAYPLALYTFKSVNITCLDQTTLASVNESITNQTNTIINNITENTQNILDSQQDINDNITNPSVDSSTLDSASNFFNNFVIDDTRGFYSIVASPIQFLRDIITSSDTCSQLQLPFRMADDNVDTGSKFLSVPCGDILWERATSFEPIWFMLIWGLAGYRVLIDMYKFVSNMVNPESTKEYYLDL